MTLPADVINRSLDMIGRSDIVIGDPSEGTDGAKVALRQYGPCLRQLLRAAHWGFARKQMNLTLLADATNSTPNVGTIVVPPWQFEYAYPVDAIKARFVPANNVTPNAPTPQGNISQPPNVPQTTVANAIPLTGYRLLPARFLIGLDWNYPVTTGPAPPWGNAPEWWGVSGEGPINRTVVLTNVQNASLVYTALVVYPDEWDVSFQEAMVQYLAAHLALPLSKDKKFGLALQAAAEAKAKAAIMQARINDGNEGVPVSDISVDWMKIRASGGGPRLYGDWGSGWGDGPGVWGYGFDLAMMPSGAAF